MNKHYTCSRPSVPYHARIPLHNGTPGYRHDGEFGSPPPCLAENSTSTTIMLTTYVDKLPHLCTGAIQFLVLHEDNNLRLLELTSNRAINTVQHPPRRAALLYRRLSRLNCCHAQRLNKLHRLKLVSIH